MFKELYNLRIQYGKFDFYSACLMLLLLLPIILPIEIAVLGFKLGLQLSQKFSWD